jgi:hypothetical protein
MCPRSIERFPSITSLFSLLQNFNTITMDEVAALPSKAIYEILMPTFKTFTPLLQAHSTSIAAIPCKTHSYGPRSHQKSTSTPSPSTASQRPLPILIFIYDDGLTGGERTPPP